MIAVLLVFIGGGLGSLCRYGLGNVLNVDSFPYGTLAANIISCLILGILIGLNINGLMKSEGRLLLMTGFCGGFSTFSTFSGEIIQLYQDGTQSTAFFYILFSLISGICSILIGLWLARTFIS